MNDEPALLASVLAAPRDDAPRLAYAAACDAKGDPRGEFIRLQLEVTNIRRAGGSVSQWSKPSTKAQAWLEKAQYFWRRQLDPWLNDHAIVEPFFYRGWVESIQIDGKRFVNDAEALFAAAPILHLRIEGGGAAVRALAASPALGRMVGLDISRQKLADDDFIALMRSPYLGSLGWLEVSHNKLGPEALEALAAAKAPRLGYVNWFGNATPDPVDTMHSDGSEILDTWPTTLGQELEARHGELAWLHAPWRFRFGYRPFPDAFD